MTTNTSLTNMTTETASYHYYVRTIEHTVEEPLPLPTGHEVVNVLQYIPQQRRMKLLIRQPATATTTDGSVTLDEIEATIEVERADKDPTCAGKDGECSRTVDVLGDYCWQHEEQEGDR